MTEDTHNVKTPALTEITEAVDIDAETELDDSMVEAPGGDVPAADATPDRSPRAWWRFARKLKPVPVILTLLLAISGSVAAWLYFTQYRPDQQTDPSVARAAATAAAEGTVALLSYAPDTLDKDFASAKTHLAGDFLTYYDQFTQQIVAPAAKQKSLKTTAHVKRAAVSELHPDSAVVLVFVDQSTTSKDSPDPVIAANSMLVTMTRVGDQWLITKFNPV